MGAELFYRYISYDINMRKVKDLLKQKQFNFVSQKDREFIVAFDDNMTKLGYDCGGKIGDGFCWGKYMLIYRKSNVKSKKVYARIYLRDKDIVLRMFFSNIDKHESFILNAPKHIKEAFTGEYGNCSHCKHEVDGNCKFRKFYHLGGQRYDKCNGLTFRFHEPTLTEMDDYIALFTVFYPEKGKRK